MAVLTVGALSLVNIAVAVSEIFAGPPPQAPALAAGQSADSHFFQFSVASDYYVMNAIVPSWPDADAVGPAAAVGSQLALTELTVGAPEAASDSVNVSMTFDVKTSDDGPTRVAPMLVDIRFPIDVLFPAQGLGFLTFSPAKRRQPVL